MRRGGLTAYHAPHPDSSWGKPCRPRNCSPDPLVGLLAACGRSNPKTEAPPPRLLPPRRHPPRLPLLPADGQAEALFKKTCAMCHQTGVASTQARRPADGACVAQARTLYKHAIEGFSGSKGAMPAKGGNPALKDDEDQTLIVDSHDRQIRNKPTTFTSSAFSPARPARSAMTGLFSRDILCRSDFSPTSRHRLTHRCRTEVRPAMAIA